MRRPTIILAALVLLTAGPAVLWPTATDARAGFWNGEVVYRKFRGDDEVSDHDREDRSDSSGHGGSGRDGGSDRGGSSGSGGSGGSSGSGKSDKPKGSGKSGTGGRSNDTDDRFNSPGR